MHIQSFDSWDAMQATMAAAEDDANRSLTPGQIRLRDDITHVRYWVQVITEFDLVIYGKAHPNHEVQKGADFDVAENRERGYLTGLAYSAGCEAGEYGDTHVSQVIPVTPTEFVMAERLGWPDMDRLKETPEGNILGSMLFDRENEAKR